GDVGQWLHHIARGHVLEIDHVMDHRALRRGERAFAFALRRDLFQFLTRGEKTNAFLFRRQQYAANKCACCQDWPERGHYYLKKAGERRQRAERKPAEERLRQNAEDEKIDRPREEYRKEKTGHSK